MDSIPQNAKIASAIFKYYTLEDTSSDMIFDDPNHPFAYKATPEKYYPENYRKRIYPLDINWEESNLPSKSTFKYREPALKYNTTYKVTDTLDTNFIAKSEPCIPAGWESFELRSYIQDIVDGKRANKGFVVAMERSDKNNFYGFRTTIASCQYESPLLRPVLSIRLANDSGEFINILKPKGSDVVTTFRKTEVMWEGSDSIGTVSIELLKEGVSILTIASGIPNNGKYIWDVPIHLEWSDKYQMKITRDDKPEINNILKEYFTLAAYNIISQYPYIQDFETYPDESEHNNIKTWYTSVEADYDWNLMTGISPERDTGVEYKDFYYHSGPLKDNSVSEDGYYLYMNSSVTYRPNKFISLSPIFNLGESSKIEFFYHLHFVDTAYGFPGKAGSLKLELLQNGNWNELFSISGNQEDKWNKVELNLTGYKGYVQFRFIGLSTYYKGNTNIGLDDIKVNSGAVGKKISKQDKYLKTTVMLNNSNLLINLGTKLKNTELKISIYDLSGRRIYIKTSSNTNKHINIDLEKIGIARGHYIVNVSNGKEINNRFPINYLN